MITSSILFALQIFSTPTLATPNLPVLVISGLKDEATVAQGANVVTVISASNAELLRSRLKEYNSKNVSGVISFGIAGALTPSVQVGDILIPKKVVSGSTSWKVDSHLTTSIIAKLQDFGLSPKRGTVTGNDLFIGVTPEDKAALHQATGADISDMESHIAAQFAKDNGLPFAVIRTISDASDFTFPPAALLPLNPDGTENQKAVDDSIWKDPGQIPALMTLNNGYKSAIFGLKQCVQALDLGEIFEAGLISH